MSRHRAANSLAALAACAVLAGVTVGCSGGDDEPRSPSGGIYGPARVEPNPGANNPVDGTDE